MKPLEQNLFEHYSLREDALLDYGFEVTAEGYVYRATLPIEGFTACVCIHNGEIDGEVFEGEEAYDAYRYNVLGSFSATVKEAYQGLLLDIRSHCYASVRPKSYCLIPSNPAVYDVERGFKENGDCLDWPTHRRLYEGDIVYIYMSRPFKGLRFRCTVIASTEAAEGYGSRRYYYNLIRRTNTFGEGKYPLDDLMTHGLKTVRFAHLVSQEFADYIEKTKDK